jgi:hypothetical protein
MDQRSDGVHAARGTDVDSVGGAAPPTDDLDGVASYEDDDAFVVCDRKNPQAWIRSDAVTDLEP